MAGMKKRKVTRTQIKHKDDNEAPTKNMKVEKDEMIPTHSIVKIPVSRNAMNQDRSFVRSLSSLNNRSNDRGLSGNNKGENNRER